MKRVKNYFDFINETDQGKLLASQPVGQIASFIDPDAMKKGKKTKEEVEKENASLASYGSGYDPELGGSKKVEALFCGEIVVSGTSYEVLSGPNKGKRGILKWLGGMDPEFEVPVGLTNFSELNPPNEESIKLMFPGIDYYSYKKFLVPEYDNTEEKYLTKLKYYDPWQTYGNVEITFNRDSPDLYGCWNWESVDGPNSGMKGSILVWQGSEDLLKGTNSIDWREGNFRKPKGTSPIKGMIYPNWALGNSIEFDSNGYLDGKSVGFPSFKRGESSEVKTGQNYPYCEDPQHFLYLGLPSGKINPPEDELFYNMWAKILIDSKYITNSYNFKTFKDNGSCFVVEGGINNQKVSLTSIQCENKEAPTSVWSGDYTGKGGQYGNLGFSYNTSEFKTSGNTKTSIQVTGEWYWDFEKKQIGVIEAQKEGSEITKFNKIEDKPKEEEEPKTVKKPELFKSVPGSDLRKDPISGDIFTSQGSLVRSSGPKY